ncbi:MAG: 4'-phosphopantetheinyl transferase superfamily protein [Chromatiales bacterium]|nr:4'-phosphopantetheinyl transferase superfamily protein [Chromatiales bacterium]
MSAASLDCLDAGRATIYSGWLDEAEKHRWRRITNDHVSNAFLLGRALIRERFSELCKCDPSDIHIEIDARGRPRLAGETKLDFNLSHSGSWVILAYGEGRVGVDIEQVRRRNWEGIADAWYHPEELRWLRSDLSLTERLRQFYRLWVLKEALVKCLGQGLNRHMLRGTDMGPIVRGETDQTAGMTFHLCDLLSPALPVALCTDRPEDPWPPMLETCVPADPVEPAD